MALVNIEQGEEKHANTRLKTIFTAWKYIFKPWKLFFKLWKYIFKAWKKFLQRRKRFLYRAEKSFPSRGKEEYYTQRKEKDDFWILNFEFWIKIRIFVLELDTHYYRLRSKRRSKNESKFLDALAPRRDCSRGALRSWKLKWTIPNRLYASTTIVLSAFLA